MATTSTDRATDTAASRGQGGDGKRYARRATKMVAIAALALTLSILGLEWRGALVAAQANAGAMAAERPTDASVTTEYRWDFGE